MFSSDFWRRKIGEAKLLTAAQEKELGAKALRGDRAARDLLVTSNLRFVAQIARAYAAVMDPDDAFSYGVFGLIRAAEKFEPARNFRFSTYAVAWIKAHIRKGYVLDSRVVKVDTTQKFRSIEAMFPHAQAFLQQRLNHDPNTEEMAEWLGVKAQDVENYLMRTQPAASLDFEHSSGDGGDSRTMHEFYADKGAVLPEEQVEQVELAAKRSVRIRWALSQLDERERRIIETRHMDVVEPKTLNELGDEMGFSRERARQIELRAMKKLKALLTGGELPEIKHRPAKVINWRRFCACGKRINRRSGVVSECCHSCRRASPQLRERRIKQSSGGK